MQCPFCNKVISGNTGHLKNHIKFCIYSSGERLRYTSSNLENDGIRWLSIYNRIIANRYKNPITEGYYEIHHIIPKSLGGSNDPKNLIKLTAREHYICHLLLVRMHSINSLERRKMLYALYRLSSGNLRISSSTYQIFREEFCNSCKGHHLQDGILNSNYGKMWISNISNHKNMLVNRNEADSYLRTGWKKGRNLWKLEESKKRLHDNRMLRLQRDIEIYKEYYNLYNKYGWERFLSLTNYPYSKSNFVMRCSKLLKEFVPQNGKKRGNLSVH